MFTVYVYTLDTLADWEIGYVTSELNSGRFFKKEAPCISIKTVGLSQMPIKTMGGLTVIPDCTIDDIAVSKTSVLILPGANTWDNPKHDAIIKKANDLVSVGAMVCAICGSTAKLANSWLLDRCPHTSNGQGFLEMVSPNYKGQKFYVDAPSVATHNLITAGSAGGLLWAKQIIEYLGVFQNDTLEFWYEYFKTGKPQHFFALMQTLSSTDK